VIADEHGAAPPWEAMRDRLAGEADAAEARGEAETAARLRGILEEWWTRQVAWNGRLTDVLGAHHEINNALVGIRGNAQLLLMNPATQVPGVRERLEVVLRESGRIQEAASRIRQLKAGPAGASSAARAA